MELPTFQANGPESNWPGFPAVLLGGAACFISPMNLSFYYVTSTLQLSSVAAVGIYSTEIGQHCKSVDEPRELVVNHPQHAISPYFLGRMAQTQGAPNPGLSQESGVPRTS